jgi:hypothetical protein
MKAETDVKRHGATLIAGAVNGRPEVDLRQTCAWVTTPDGDGCTPCTPGPYLPTDSGGVMEVSSTAQLTTVTSVAK